MLKSSWYKQICKAFGSELKSWFSLQAVPSRNDNIDLSEPLPGMEFSASKWLKASSCCSIACNVGNKGIYWIDSSFWVIGLNPISIFFGLMKHLYPWISSSTDFFPLNLSIKCNCKRTYTVHYYFCLVINLKAFMITLKWFPYHWNAYFLF